MQENKKSFAVAIDGPSGAGKSTVAKLLAKELGFIYVDTGAMYRTVALYCIRENIDCGTENAVIEAMDKINIDMKYKDGASRVYLNGEDVTDELRTQKVADGSSKVAIINAVREKLVALQKWIGGTNDVVMDGRDITTNVLPNAQVKAYIDASAHERTLRRIKELTEKGIPSDYDVIKREIEERDYRDMNREHSPLVRSPEAELIFTDDMTIDDVKNKLLSIIKKIR